jgi:hypothetical protein
MMDDLQSQWHQEQVRKFNEKRASGCFFAEWLLDGSHVAGHLGRA